MMWIKTELILRHSSTSLSFSSANCIGNLLLTSHLKRMRWTFPARVLCPPSMAADMMGETSRSEDRQVRASSEHFR